MTAGCFCSSGSAADGIPEELQNLYARSAVLMDGSSGRILFEKNGGEILPMASTTKIMTCILALETGDPEDMVTVSANAASQPEVKLGVREGEQYLLKDLLYSLMLESHNDSAVVIAEHIGGSVEQFAVLMNAKARELGCAYTHYVTPNGLDGADEGGAHSTTAGELARVMTYCISESPKREEFLEITGTRSWNFQNGDRTRSFSCYNHNAFLDMMEGAISGKTGFTNAAGYCYVGALKRDDRVFVVALLACGWPYNRTYKWQDTKKLMEYGIAHYHNEEIICSLEEKQLTVEGGLMPDGNPFYEPLVPIAPEIPKEKKQYLMSDTEEIQCQVTIKKKLTAPVEKGSVVGKMRYYLDGQFLEEYPIITTSGVPKRHLKHCFVWLVKTYGF